MEKAKYRGVNCWVDPNTGAVGSDNWFDDLLIDFWMFWDIKVMGYEYLNFELIEEEPEKRENEIIFKFDEEDKNI